MNAQLHVDQLRLFSLGNHHIHPHELSNGVDSHREGPPSCILQALLRPEASVLADLRPELLGPQEGMVVYHSSRKFSLRRRQRGDEESGSAVVLNESSREFVVTSTPSGGGAARPAGVSGGGSFLAFQIVDEDGGEVVVAASEPRLLVPRLGADEVWSEVQLVSASDASIVVASLDVRLGWMSSDHELTQQHPPPPLVQAHIGGLSASSPRSLVASHRKPPTPNRPPGNQASQQVGMQHQTHQQHQATVRSIRVHVHGGL